MAVLPCNSGQQSCINPAQNKSHTLAQQRDRLTFANRLWSRAYAKWSNRPREVQQSLTRFIQVSRTGTKCPLSCQRLVGRIIMQWSWHQRAGQQTAVRTWWWWYVARTQTAERCCAKRSWTLTGRRFTASKRVMRWHSCSTVLLQVSLTTICRWWQSNVTRQISHGSPISFAVSSVAGRMHWRTAKMRGIEIIEIECSRCQRHYSGNTMLGRWRDWERITHETGGIASSKSRARKRTQLSRWLA